MSRRIQRSALAVTLDGQLLVNIAEFHSGKIRPEALLRTALEQHGSLFVGVVLSRLETDRAIARIDNAATEAAGFVVGARQHRRQRKK